MKQYYKGARLDGWDWYTGNSVNYREAIGKTVRVKDFDLPAKLCDRSVLHASMKPLGVFQGCKLPLSMFKVSGVPVVEDSEKAGFKELKILCEIPQGELDGLFGFRYSEACSPIQPFKLKPSIVGVDQVALLRTWASVRDSVRDSVWASVGDSVRDSVWDSVRASVRASVWDSVGDSVRASVWDSVGDSVRAYIGSFFPNIAKWLYIEHKLGEYPFQAAVDLWKQGLIPSFDGETWRIHGGEKAEVLYHVPAKKLRKET